MYQQTKLKHNYRTKRNNNRNKHFSRWKITTTSLITVLMIYFFLNLVTVNQQCRRQYKCCVRVKVIFSKHTLLFYAHKSFLHSKFYVNILFYRCFFMSVCWNLSKNNFRHLDLRIRHSPLSFYRGRVLSQNRFLFYLLNFHFCTKFSYYLVIITN